MATKTLPLSKIFDDQVALTRGYAREVIALRGAFVGEAELTRELLRRYSVPDSLIGGCVAACTIDGRPISLHYLKTLQLTDRVRRLVPLERRSFAV
jgi:hypothetical protein